MDAKSLYRLKYSIRQRGSESAFDFFDAKDATNEVHRNHPIKVVPSEQDAADVIFDFFPIRQIRLFDDERIRMGPIIFFFYSG